VKTEKDMKANELRVGNLVYHSITGEVWDIDLDFFHDLVSGGFTLDDIEPIPLNEEWLIRFGFVKEKSEWYVLKRGSKKTNNLKMFHISIFKDGYNTKGGEKSKYTPIKKVHQLQNLYFALTEQELISQIHQIDN
jgi:hypothetical protein